MGGTLAGRTAPAPKKSSPTYPINGVRTFSSKPRRPFEIPAGPQHPRTASLTAFAGLGAGNTLQAFRPALVVLGRPENATIAMTFPPLLFIY